MLYKLVYLCCCVKTADSKQVSAFSFKMNKCALLYATVLMIFLVRHMVGERLSVSVVTLSVLHEDSHGFAVR